MKSWPCVFIGSITSFLSFTVNEPAIASMRPIGMYLPTSITNPVEIGLVLCGLMVLPRQSNIPTGGYEAKALLPELTIDARIDYLLN